MCVTDLNGYLFLNISIYDLFHFLQVLHISISVRAFPMALYFFLYNSHKNRVTILYSKFCFNSSFYNRVNYSIIEEKIEGFHFFTSNIE